MDWDNEVRQNPDIKDIWGYLTPFLVLLFCLAAILLAIPEKTGGKMTVLKPILPETIGLWTRPGTPQLITAENIELSAPLRPLYEYLVAHGHIEPIQDYRKDLFDINSEDLLAMIEAGKSGWEEWVPPGVGKLIKERGLFGWPHS